MSEFESSTSNVVSVTDSDTNNIDSIKREAEKVLPCALADFAGALSWQIPLSVEQKKQVLEAVRLFIAGLDDTPQPDPVCHHPAAQPVRPCRPVAWQECLGRHAHPDRPHQDHHQAEKHWLGQRRRQVIRISASPVAGRKRMRQKVDARSSLEYTPRPDCESSHLGPIRIRRR